MEELKGLLNEIKRLSDINRKLQKERQSRGEAFNFFSEMNMSTDEVHLHSAFLSMLLNPQASHGQKGKFLKLFIELLDSNLSNNSKVFEMNAEDATVYIEKSIGLVNGEYGGRIDIYITDLNNHHIIIENKIYAGDQENQMKRYWNFVEQKCQGDQNNYRLVYLTLDGHLPSEDSLKGLQPDAFICLSYKSNIIPWLETCLEQSARLPLIRETIYQYIDVLKQITYSNMDNTEEVLKIMSKEEYLDSVFEIANNINPMIDNIINNVLYPQLVDIAKSKGMELQFNKGKNWMTTSYAGWSFVSPNWKHFCICLEFEKRGLRDLIIGFHILDGQLRQDIRCWNELWKRTTGLDKDNTAWIYINFPDYPVWYKSQSLRAITDGTTMKTHISKLLDTLIGYTEGLEV